MEKSRQRRWWSQMTRAITKRKEAVGVKKISWLIVLQKARGILRIGRPKKLRPRIRIQSLLIYDTVF